MRQHFSRVKGVALVTVRRRIAGRRRRNLRPERSNPLTGENFSCGKVRELRALPVFPSFVETLRQYSSQVKGVALVTVRRRFAKASWSTGRNFFSIFLFQPIVFFSFLIIIYSMDGDIAWICITAHNNYYVMPLNSKYRIKKRISGKTEKKNSTEKRGYNEFKSAIYLHKKSA